MLVAALLVAALAVTAAALLWRREGPPAPARAVDRAGGSDPEARVAAFWAWWTTAGPRIAAALDAGDHRSFVGELSARVDAIDPALAWETGPGLAGSRHQLVLSAEGDGALRVLTERWRARAPPPDACWEYYPARQPLPPSGPWSLTLDDAGGVAIDYERARIAVTPDPARERLDVRVHHPAFAPLDEKQRLRATFVMLDNLLGEDGVERWLGRIDLAVAAPPDGRPAGALRAAVDELSRTAKGEAFALLQGRTPSGEPLVVLANLALKRLDHLLMDHHLSVTVPLRSPTAPGLTTSDEADALNGLEDELLATLGKDAVYLGRETGRGERIMHFQVAGHGPAEERTRAWAARRAERRARVALEPDPRWSWLGRW